MTEVLIEQLKEIDQVLADSTRVADAPASLVQAVRFVGLALIFLAQKIEGKT